jgi:hypothetical protein
MVLASSLVLLYSPSGAGKSSLIHAGLVPTLRKRGVTVYPVVRIRPTGEDRFENGIENPYIRALAGNWAAIADAPESAGDGQPHAERLKEVRDLPGFVALLAEVYGSAADRPRVLIIDQFEELFTFLPEHWEQRSNVFEQIEAAVKADPGLSVLLSMREDYIALTDPFAELVSNHLRQRFRIETLREPQALEAIQRPVGGTGREFAPGAAEALVRDLMQIRIDRGRKDRKPDKVLGEYVEPVQLQVVCRRFWEELPESTGEITRDDVADYADVDGALMRFYDDAVRSAAGKDLRARERRIRTWIGNDLITVGETRGTAHRDAAVRKGVAPSSLDELVGWHLLKTEWRNGSDWYEITHDRLIDPIRRSNRRYQDRRTSRRIRALASAVVVLLVVGATTVLGMTIQSSSALRPSPMLVVTRTTVAAGPANPFPVITVPANAGLYRRGSVVRASFSCPDTSAGAAIACHGTVPRGEPIDTSQLGFHNFAVTATYGPSATTSGGARYRVVAFSSATYHGHAFSIAYPGGWKLEDAEAQRPGYSDTTIVSPANGETYMRVDVTRSRRVKPLKPMVDNEVRAVARESGYRLLSRKPTTFEGNPGIDWWFVVREGGGLVEKEDLFFNGLDNHGIFATYAVLTQAPVRKFGHLAAEFGLLRGTMVVPSMSSGPNCSESGLVAAGYSLCRLTTGQQCPAGLTVHVVLGATDVCLKKKA